jgi:hypothetical protein
MNDPLKLINKIEFPTCKWVVMNTINVEVCKIANTLEKDL